MTEEEKDSTEFGNQEESLQQDVENPVGEVYQTIQLSGMYKNWFLDYASYVILERAVPDVADGLKPVQRRILQAMKDLDDGRYNKVANIIGHTMKYHPHGDASIGDALVQLGQKELLIDMQGNWGNVHTGDRAAAPRYIEARLSKFALEVVFNPKTTRWKSSYDGRNKEPIALPVKFPLMLAQGVEGIAVGLASKILPHNFIELIDASIKYLKGEEFELFPDFLTGGLADFTKYNDGLRGGKIRVRARINKVDKKTLSITEIPFGTTTSSLIDSIVQANDKGKIKIKKIDDNTAEHVEIIIQLNPGISPDQTIDALYAFTNCELSVSPNCCVIENDKPKFVGVTYVLKTSTDNTLRLLKLELEIRMFELAEAWHFLSLEKIFIENRIYHDIESCTTWESVIKTIDKGLDPFKKLFRRDITEEDIVRLTEIKIKRISKFSSDKADDQIAAIEGEMAEVQNHLDNLIDFVINYFRQIKKKYAKGKERQTEIRNFDTIEAAMVAAATQKLYVNKEEGFAGTSLKKDEFICDCSDIDDVIVFREDGTFTVSKVSPKHFVGKGIIHIDVFKRNDDRTIYNMIYRDSFRGNSYVKRFSVQGITRDKEYDLTMGNKGTRVIYFTVNPNGEAEIVKVHLRPKPKLKKLAFEYDFKELAIKSRASKGNIITRHSIRNIIKKEEGVSTLGAVSIWYDDTVKRLNSEERGTYLGAYLGQDKILTVMRSGCIKLTGFDVSTHFDENMFIIQKFDPDLIYTVIYYDGEAKKYYVKRFQLEAESHTNKEFDFIGEHKSSLLIEISMDYRPQMRVDYKQIEGKKAIEPEILELDEFIGIKGLTAKGKRISTKEIKKITMLEPLPYEKPVVEQVAEEVTETEVVSSDEKEESPSENTSDNEISKGNVLGEDDDDTQMTLEF
jgi:topoisomerase IV subunit A